MVKKEEHGERDAEELSKELKQVSVSAFFERNRHLLGYDNLSKALLKGASGRRKGEKKEPRFSFISSEKIETVSGSLGNNPIKITANPTIKTT